MPKGDEWTTEEIYPCRGVCGLGSARPDPTRRRELRCALPGFDESRWLDVETPRPYMGRLPIYGDADASDDVRPDERPDAPRDSHDDGCPGSWYRCAFVVSLSKYERHFTDGGFVSNMLADRTQDRLVLEALQMLESERIRARAHARETRNK